MSWSRSPLAKLHLLLRWRAFPALLIVIYVASLSIFDAVRSCPFSFSENLSVVDVGPCCFRSLLLACSSLACLEVAASSCAPCSSVLMISLKMSTLSYRASKFSSVPTEEGPVLEFAGFLLRGLGWRNSLTAAKFNIHYITKQTGLQFGHRT